MARGAGAHRPARRRVDRALRCARARPDRRLVRGRCAGGVRARDPCLLRPAVGPRPPRAHDLACRAAPAPALRPRRAPRPHTARAAPGRRVRWIAAPRFALVKRPRAPSGRRHPWVWGDETRSRRVGCGPYAPRWSPVTAGDARATRAVEHPPPRDTTTRSAPALVPLHPRLGEAPGGGPAAPQEGAPQRRRREGGADDERPP